ncbi:tRNA synthetase RNA-binding protein [Actibacterium mucosum KCTC 23349]|uniref:tRNA synthetase RNA-binding protein n=1 Tax=Actibacterium mucosum KCTC 23349 TaxID=1454373 RepID=A0A037ZKB1_9RHOB|nr:RNA-binding S4 domain-containing protein [Actibacterium mucosum]KAJ55266.1 tRNA synthetase RNA-binding protein [Actibacterium mucosum KCTC 23349]
MAEGPTIRLDKWLWYARFYKTRSLATKQVSGGHVRVNGTKVDKPATKVGPGDTLTFAQGREIRVVRVIALGERRGPAPEAQALYDDLTPKREENIPSAPRFEGKGRPTKKDRRALDFNAPGRLE